ncbi:MAG: GYD domain-containing protein [Chloroflexi bacterium]|nr:GYD domain-containing protein [Chloroflexota bacterium]
METYIILGSYTKEGVSEIKESPARIEAARKATEEAGGKFLSWHLTMGRYDFVAITQVPDSKTGASILLAIGGLGKVRTETMQAFTESEFKEMVAGLS